MDQAHAQAFKEADRLFREGRFGEALSLLQRINQAYPNEKNVLYPMALCCAQLGNNGEAVRICNHLLNAFQDPRARQLIGQLSSARTMQAASAPQFSADDGTAVTGVLDDILGPPPGVRPGAANRQSDFDWKPYLIGGVMVAAVVVFLCIPLLTGSGYSVGDTLNGGVTNQLSSPPDTADGMSGAQGTSEPNPESTAILVIFLFVFGFVLQTALLYVVMSIQKYHLHDEFWPNLRVAALTSLLIQIVGLVPYVGWLFGFVVLKQAYGLTILQTILVYIVNFVIVFVSVLILSATLAGAFIAVAPA